MSISLLAFELTDTNREWLIHKPLAIVSYIVVAVVLRYVLHKLIDRMTLPRDPARPPKRSILRPLQDRAGKPLGDPAARERRAQRAQTIGSVFKSGVSIIVLGWVVLQTLDRLGFNVAPFIASAGIAGVALGFGAQNLVRDFISGMFMLLEDQYGVGDVVDVGDAIGTVESVGLRVTTIRDIDGTLWYCRNGEILRVGNMSQGHAVAVVDVPIAPTANVDRAQQVAFRAVIETADRDDIAPYVLEKPELLGVNSVTAGAVTLRMTVRVRAGKQWAVRRALTGAVLESFDSNGIESPSLMLAPVAT
ncbi:mechanosensitive ion channel [Rhodococcus sp. HNM0563]|uniref:mechanosensitive ion channel family protein n=1 Tax=unclassified Rhodococcus (in: high G+C Gram-positive bacteria) TaxID=192944 RepID=UPI00146F0852|nr:MULTISPECIES: mechanosensitive ion channel domain-containing protein [unclassified Rhodococcus (in: high G+C Gram-positive bacteria)]MCK0089742.1 mechanosensitive ion channel family protein [Rhodococcus sp. F64268]NLU62309.1 mechanosensitive ion channel [Rhodococcus sp. HNM0563]